MTWAASTNKKRNRELPCLVICPSRRRFPLESSHGTSPGSLVIVSGLELGPPHASLGRNCDHDYYFEPTSEEERDAQSGDFGAARLISERAWLSE